MIKLTEMTRLHGEPLTDEEKKEIEEGLNIEVEWDEDKKSDKKKKE